MWLWWHFWHLPLWWPETGPGYALGSSWAGANLSFMAGAYVLYRRHNCHKPWCLRITRHITTVDGHQQMYCHKHHARENDN